MAGHETTSASLSFTLWELGRNPEKQKRLRDEVLAYHGNPSYDDLQIELPYLDACCREGLRLHPPSAHMERIAENQDVIPLRFPVTNTDGTKSTQLLVEKGQVRSLSSTQDSNTRRETPLTFAAHICALDLRQPTEFGLERRRIV
jgi:hypothetical protein